MIKQLGAIEACDSDLIYYTASFFQNELVPVQIQYYDQRQSDILKNPCDYFLSIIRFRLPASDIPVLLFQTTIQQYFPAIPTSLSPNYGIYTFTLTYAGAPVPEVQQPVIFVTQELQVPVPPPVSISSPQQKTPYYYVYNYKHMVDMMNTCLTSILATMFAGPPPFFPPYFIYDPDTKLISLIAPRSQVQPGGLLHIYCNFPMGNLIYAIKLIHQPLPIINGKEFEIPITLTQDNLYFPPGVTSPATTPPPSPGASDYVKLQAEYVNYVEWDPLKKIVITTSMPILQEGLSASNNFNSININSASSAYLSILTDFIPDTNGQPGLISTQFNYLPTAEYRLISFNSTKPLSEIKFDVYWSDYTNTLYPFFILPGGNVDIKFLFRKKTLSDGVDPLTITNLIGSGFTGINRRSQNTGIRGLKRK